MYEIEKNIPIPDRRNHPPRFELIANKMEEGDSIVVEGYSEYTSLRHCFNKSGYTASYRTLYNKEGEKLGWRVWKVKKEVKGDE